MKDVRDLLSYFNDYTLYNQHCLEHLKNLNHVRDILFRDLCKGDEASDFCFEIVVLVTELTDMILFEKLPDIMIKFDLYQQKHNKKKHFKGFF